MPSLFSLNILSSVVESLQLIFDLNLRYIFAGDSLGLYNGFPFSTKDRDNNKIGDTRCAVWFNGGWWYGPWRGCFLSKFEWILSS